MIIYLKTKIKEGKKSSLVRLDVRALRLSMKYEHMIYLKNTTQLIQLCTSLQTFFCRKQSLKNQVMFLQDIVA